MSESLRSVVDQMLLELREADPTGYDQLAAELHQLTKWADFYAVDGQLQHFVEQVIDTCRHKTGSNGCTVFDLQGPRSEDSGVGFCGTIALRDQLSLRMADPISVLEAMRTAFARINLHLEKGLS